QTNNDIDANSATIRIVLRNPLRSRERRDGFIIILSMKRSTGSTSRWMDRPIGPHLPQPPPVVTIAVMTRVFLGIGSNVGDRRANIERARAGLAALPGT